METGVGLDLALGLGCFCCFSLLPLLVCWLAACSWLCRAGLGKEACWLCVAEWNSRAGNWDVSAVIASDKRQAASGKRRAIRGGVPGTGGRGQGIRTQI